MATTPAAPAFDACAQCEAPFERGVRYPVVAVHEPAGEIRLHSFCDKQCLAAWRRGD